MQKACERGIKQTSMIDMGSIAYGKRDDKPQDKQKKQESKKANRQARKQERRQTSKKTNKRWCLQMTNVGLDRMSITSLC